MTYFLRTRPACEKIGWRDGAAGLSHMVHYSQMTSVDKAFAVLPARYWP